MIERSDQTTTTPAAKHSIAREGLSHLHFIMDTQRTSSRRRGVSRRWPVLILLIAVPLHSSRLPAGISGRGSGSQCAASGIRARPADSRELNGHEFPYIIIIIITTEHVTITG